MKLLLHICCGPCACYPVETLQEAGIDFTGYYFNPNIHPMDEFERRRENLQILSELKGFPVIYSDAFDQPRWEFFQGEIVERCRMCYEIRFAEVVRKAAEEGYDAFSTTLLVSPYQRHEMIIEICEKYAAQYGIQFYYEDWRPGFRKGQAMAKEYGLYRQKYCGCIRSKSYQ